MTLNGPLESPLIAAEETTLEGASVSIGYGKAGITIYRCDVPAQSGVLSIPESDFAGWPGPLLAATLTVETTGTAFLPSWTTGDNSGLVATDTIRNFALHRAATYGGTTVEGLAAYIGRALLNNYSDMARLRLTGRHLRFAPIGKSGVALVSQPGLGMTTTVAIERTDIGPTVTSVGCGLDGMRFARVRGSHFLGFLRDEYTTLPETVNRPLEIRISVRWWYGVPGDAIADDLSRWVPPDTVADLLTTVFARTPTRSIQQLLTVLARAMLDRFGSVERVWLEAENRVWSAPTLPAPDGGAPVHSASLPAHGILRMALSRQVGPGPATSAPTDAVREP